MIKKKTICAWNAAYFGVSVQSSSRHFVVSAMPNMIGRLDTAVKCCETMGNWHLPTYKEMEVIADAIPNINALMEENGGHRIDLESVLWLDGDYGHSSSLKVGEGLCYILQYRQDTLSWWWNRREFRLVMPLD
jgi:hypothetical protein